ncbi:hypothetical protein B0H15DRAFT_944735 [Mycena belliarum]|uniref:Uncharacterized protein n=1 Tax=Mycena belliarum TaxID=1033014 RepID=A0AAD6XS21_9AGAR|nr:hypothetical protein B0H15DRAFT_944735 [Mycena belliae]
MSDASSHQRSPSVVDPLLIPVDTAFHEPCMSLMQPEARPPCSACPPGHYLPAARDSTPAPPTDTTHRLQMGEILPDVDHIVLNSLIGTSSSLSPTLSYDIACQARCPGRLEQAPGGTLQRSPSDPTGNGGLGLDGGKEGLSGLLEDSDEIPELMYWDDDGSDSRLMPTKK